MGYYSDVALLLSREADGELRVALVKAPEDVRQLFKGCAPEVDAKTGLRLRHWEHVRWEGDVAEFVDSFLAALDGDQYRFLRLGERFGDLDDYGGIYDSPFGLEVVAKIEFRKPPIPSAKNAHVGRDAGAHKSAGFSDERSR